MTGDVADDQGGLGNLTQAVREFAHARNWERFHTPKNLVMALAGEAGELAAEFQWLTPDDSFDVMTDTAKRAAVEDEIADVVLYLVRLADVLDVDLTAVAGRKLRRNETRFPAPPRLGEGTTDRAPEAI